MINHGLIQTSRFCNDLHNGETVFFCKRDFILDDFNYISTLGRDVIMIVGNSDYTFDYDILGKCPLNVKHIFTTNTICDNEKVTPIPLGVEMEEPTNRPNHGFVNQGFFEKKSFLLENKQNEFLKNEKIYANFNIKTNLELRSPLKNFCLKSQNILFEDKTTYPEFVNKIKSHIGTLSPRGNGIECVRTYEILYLNEIPIVVGNINEYSVTIKNIYNNLPVIFIEDFNELNHIDLIKEKIEEVIGRPKNYLDYYYWLDRINDKIKKLGL